MHAGNRSALVLVDSRLVGEKRDVELELFTALRHMGLAFELWDAADGFPSASAHFSDRGLYVLGHDGAGRMISAARAKLIVAGVQAGAGFFSFDRRVEEWPLELQALAPKITARWCCQDLQFARLGHYLAEGHAPGSAWCLQRPVACACTDDNDWQAVVLANGKATIATRTAGGGRQVFFGCGIHVYREDVYGHGRGFDGLLWRSIVWVAAKPLPTRSMPPYLTARVDDCNGAYSAFGWVEAFNRHGIAPNIGLFIDELGPSDWAGARKLFAGDQADFSMHAFRDDFYKARSNYRPYAVLADKPDLSNGGQTTLFEGLGLDHDTGLNLPPEVLRRNVRRMDDAFATAGIRHSRIINAHFGEVSFTSIPYYLERGANFLCNNNVPGQLYANQPLWRARPYGLRGHNGRPGTVIDQAPGHPDLFFTSVAAPSYEYAPTHPDVLNGHVPFLGESPTVKREASVARGCFNVNIALDMMAWGLIMTHEERIDAISMEDWDAVVDGIVKQSSRDWDLIPAKREQVSIICQRLFRTSMVAAWAGEDGRVVCELTGKNDGPSPMTIWYDEGETCRRTFVEIPIVDGYLKTEPLGGK